MSNMKKLVEQAIKDALNEDRDRKTKDFAKDIVNGLGRGFSMDHRIEISQNKYATVNIRDRGAEYVLEFTFTGSKASDIHFYEDGGEIEVEMDGPFDMKTDAPKIAKKINSEF